MFIMFICYIINITLPLWFQCSDCNNANYTIIIMLDRQLMVSTDYTIMKY